MLVPCKPSDAHSRCCSVRCDLNCPTILILIRNHGRDSPCLRTMPRWQRASTIEELAARPAVCRACALRDPLQHTLDDHTINHCFRTQQPGLSCSIIVLLPTK